MRYVVVLPLIEANFIEQMTRMRSWLDHRRVEPTLFRVVNGDAAGGCRVQFTSEADAVGFAAEFGGELTAIAAAPGVGKLKLRSASLFGSGRVRPS